jgi:DNA-binding response OmpR family regulator
MSHPHKIFIVDDNRDAADTLGMFFENHGFEVRVAYDGDDAIREVDEFQPEVALLDIGLPGKDGYQIAQHIRAGRDGDMMIIAVSGYAAAEDVARAKDAGFDFHFGKPANPTILLSKIEGRLGGPPATH